MRQLAQLGTPADEGVALGGQVVRHVGERPPRAAGLHDAVALGGVVRRLERRPTGASRLVHLDRLVDALQPVVAVVLPLRAVDAALRQRLARGGGGEDLAAGGHRHHACRERLRQPFHLQRLGAARHVVGRRGAQRHRPDVQADPRRQAERTHVVLVGKREAQRRGGIVEKHEEAVGGVDLAPALAAQEVARAAVVLGPQHPRALVAQALRDERAVDDVGEEQCRQIAHAPLACANRAAILCTGPGGVSELTLRAPRLLRSHPEKCP